MADRYGKRYNHLAPCIECLRLQWKVLVSVNCPRNKNKNLYLPYLLLYLLEPRARRASECRVGIRPRAFTVLSQGIYNRDRDIGFEGQKR